MKKIGLIVIICLILQTTHVMAANISAEYACVMEPTTKTIIYEKNAHMKHSMASTTKIMTALLAIKNQTLDNEVTISKKASSQEGSSIYLRAGDKIIMRDLLYGLMLNSGNDAAVAVAEHISGSVDEFANEMTQTAHAIGATHTQFKNPNGLDAEGHYTTAYDLALITARALEYPEFREIVSCKNKTATLTSSGAKLYFHNHNKMLSLYEGAIGVKTGFTKATGRCLVSAAQNGALTMIAVTLDAPNDWNDHKKMLDLGFEKFETKTILKKGDIIKEKMIGGKSVQLLTAEDIVIPIEKNTAYHAEINMNVPNNLPSPLNLNEKVGVAEIVLKNQIVKKVDIIAGSEVLKEKKLNYIEWCVKIIKIWLE